MSHDSARGSRLEPELRPEPRSEPRSESGPRLESWKQIAAHVGRDARTAQRWEKTEGLPVHRHRHAKRDTVFAFPSELDAWLEERTAREQPSRSPGAAHPIDPQPPASREGRGPRHDPGRDPGRAGLTGVRRRAWALLGFAAVTALLWGTLLGPFGEQTSQRTKDSAAREAWQGGRYVLHQGGVDGLRRAVERFEEAVARDPDFAGAYAGLATSLAFTGRYGLVPPTEAFPRARVAAERALGMDSSDAEAHAALALVAFYHDRDFQAAAEAFGEALRLAPDRALTHHALAHFLSCLGLHDAAVRAARTARDLEPLSSLIAVDTSWLLFRARDFEAAVKECRRALALEPGQPSAAICLAESLERLGDPEAAWQALRVHGMLEFFETQSVQLDHSSAELALQALRRQRREALEQRVRTEWVSAHARVFSLVGLDRDDELLAELGKALDERDRVVLLTRVHPSLDEVRDDPRFEAIVEAVGFPDDAALLLEETVGPWTSWPMSIEAD